MGTYAEAGEDHEETSEDYQPGLFHQHPYSLDQTRKSADAPTNSTAKIMRNKDPPVTPHQDN